jgi:phage repressor protein C with HTH and peptisase S24 domain
MALKDRIKEIVDSGYTKAAIARAAGKTGAAVTHWLNGETAEIKSDAAAGIQEKTGFSAVWIATGKLPKRVPNIDATESAQRLIHTTHHKPPERRFFYVRVYHDKLICLVRFTQSI